MRYSEASNIDVSETTAIDNSYDKLVEYQVLVGGDMKDAKRSMVLLVVAACCLMVCSLSFANDSLKDKEKTYTITSVMYLLPPVRVSDMNDDYQSARLIDKKGDRYKVEITYYPFIHDGEEIGENPNWREDCAKMTEYLMPRPSANWDEQMRKDLIAELKKDGIDPNKLTDKSLVEQVSSWVLRRCRYLNEFTAWCVDFPNGKPEVYPPLRQAFDKNKADASWSDQQVFDNEVLGKGMFYNKVRGQCTSSAVLMTTVLRALGIPTRMVICIPPADPNDPNQVELLRQGIHHNMTRRDIEIGLLSRGFCDHMFNEVYIDHHWVRLNYSKLGQKPVDKQYFGLMTHIYTFNDLSELPIASTWGMRYFHADSEHSGSHTSLSSDNPYMLLKVSDHFGQHSQVSNPDVPELRNVAIDRLYWLGADRRPAERPIDGSIACTVRLQSGCDYSDLRMFWRRASSKFVLRSPGYPDIPAMLTGSLQALETDQGKCDVCVVSVSSDELRKIIAGVDYRLVPIDQKDKYIWEIADKATIKIADGVTHQSVE